MSFLVKSILPQSHFSALTVSTCSPPDNRQVSRNGQGCPSPPCHTQPTPQCRNKAPCGKKHQLIPLARRQGGRESDKNSISKKWGLHGTTSAELELGAPCNLLGKQVSEEETLVSTVRHTDLVRQISRQTLKLCTGKTAHELPWF